MPQVSAAPKTLTVEQAGRDYFGLSRASSYAAVKRGDIPVIKIGRLLRVPVAALEAMMQQPNKASAAK
ncbi:helix-turn-helix domain-containing protein [Bradyrhizobium guangzhouense]|uniref:helix-turn-helix domain-containing protein n=1 Tax=Bradyrhizobium guangzhouense TaxID=1325095 RepID=UPI001009BEC0|nr:helix-turn-helix domain-containing protein [Bradyrhizobium guangzhouense]RXH15235.1 DNA-binding protein [Bradyrhizobium guangzhouense]